MQACCDVAFAYAHQREAFGEKIGSFQVYTDVKYMYIVIPCKISPPLNFSHHIHNAKINPIH